MGDMKYEVSSSLCPCPSLSPTLTGAPVGLTAKLGPGNSRWADREVKTETEERSEGRHFLFVGTGQSLPFFHTSPQL